MNVQRAFAIGLYSYSNPSPGRDGFRTFHDLVISIFRGVGVVPTYFAAEGVGCRGDLTTYGGKTHTKALKSNFEGIHVMSLVANPEGSGEPGYDSYASASLAYIKETGETLLCLAMEERYLEFGGEDFEKVLMSLVAMRSWDFGYALSLPIEKKPEFHVLGLDGGTLTPEELRQLNKWYGSPPDERLRKIRDIYPYNIINSTQLGTQISGSETLKDVISRNSNSSLRHLDGSRLWMWKVQPNALIDVRNKLAESGVLIT